MTAEVFKSTVCVHLDAMYRVALALCGDGADAADAVQNAASTCGKNASGSTVWPTFRPTAWAQPATLP